MSDEQAGWATKLPIDGKCGYCGTEIVQTVCGEVCPNKDCGYCDGYYDPPVKRISNARTLDEQIAQAELGRERQKHPVLSADAKGSFYLSSDGDWIIWDNRPPEGSTPLTRGLWYALEAAKAKQIAQDEKLKEALKQARCFIQDVHDWMHHTTLRPLPNFLMSTATLKSYIDSVLKNKDKNAPS